MANGPAPNAGSRWSRASSGAARDEQRESDGQHHVGLSPDEQADRHEGRRDDHADRESRDRFAEEHRTHRNADAQAADDDRLGLRAHRVGDVDDARDEERQHHAASELILERAHDARREERTDEPEKQPREPVPQAPSDRLDHGLTRVEHTGETRDVFVVLL